MQSFSLYAFSMALPLNVVAYIIHDDPDDPWFALLAEKPRIIAGLITALALTIVGILLLLWGRSPMAASLFVVSVGVVFRQLQVHWPASAKRTTPPKQ